MTSTGNSTGAKAQRQRSGPSDPQSTDQGVREKIARIVSPHAFLEALGGHPLDDMINEIVRQDREDALRKADAILSLLAGDGSSQAQQSPAGLGLHPSEDQAPSADNQEGH